jgi:DNA invertase Pin-like site-specific DNA recombinase
MRAAIYVRVSTADQITDLQIRDLQEFVARQGWEIMEIYQDVISGAKASRPGLNRLMEDARARKFEILLVWKLDRFGRSLVDCLNNIKTPEDHGIRSIAVTQGLDTDLQNPASRFLLHVLGAAAEFERSLIRERTQAGRLRHKHDYAAGQSWQDSLQKEPGAASAKEDLQSRYSGHPPRPRPQHTCDRHSARVGGGNCGPDAAGAFQKFVADVWNRSSSLSPFTTKAGGNSVSRNVVFQPSML